MAVQPPEIEAFPPTPQRKNKDTFANLFDDVISWFSRSVSKVGQACLSAYENAVGAEASAIAAAAAAESAIFVAGATEWVSGKAYTKGACVWLPGANGTWRRQVAGSGTLAPNLDPANWRPVAQVGFSNIVVIRTTQNWTPPPGIVRAEITVINGGAQSFPGGGGAGYGGSASISVRDVSSAVAYTATVGAGGTGGTNTGGTRGGLSSFSGAGLTTLTSSNGDIRVGGSSNGASLYSGSTTISDEYGQIGQGGPNTGSQTGTGSAGYSGGVIIRY